MIPRAMLPIGRRRFLTILGGAAAGGASALGAPLLFRPLFAGPADSTAAAPPLGTWPGGFPLDPAVASQVLVAARRRGAPFAEIYVEMRTRTRVTLAESQVESIEQGVFAGCGIRVVDGERTGYAYADSFALDPLTRAAENAAAIASRSATDSAAAVAFTTRAPAPATYVQCAEPLDRIAAQDRVGWIERADRAARAYDASVKQVTIEHTDEMHRFAVINSEGLWIEDVMPLLYLRVDVVAMKGEKRGSGFERLSRRLGAEQMQGDVPEAGGREAARMAVAMIEAEPAPAGEMPVVLAAGGGVLFHEAVGHGLEGDGVRLKTSFYAGKVGERVGADGVSVFDTGAKPALRGSYNIDDEGTPPVVNQLIENGILRGFLTDRMTADLLALPRTGNGRRESYRHPPLVRMSNTYLGAGSDPPEDIVKATKRGLYAAALGGGEVNTTTGNFTFGVREAYRIEDGKLTHPVRGANLVGNGPEIMQRIDRIGPDLKFWNGTCGKGQWVPVTSGAPTLRIASMTVGGSEQG
jgi:TldD protein